MNFTKIVQNLFWWPIYILAAFVLFPFVLMIVGGVVILVLAVVSLIFVIGLAILPLAACWWLLTRPGA